MGRVAEVRGTGSPQIALWQGLQPEMASAMLALSETVYQNTRLSYRVAEAARIRIADINGCQKCRSFRVADDLEDLLSRAGVDEEANVAGSRGERPTEEFYAAVGHWRDSDLFSDRERLAMRYAELIAESPRDLPYDDEFWERLHAAFDDREIVDLTYSITTWIATGRFIHVLGFSTVSCTVEPAPTLQGTA